jgi:AcrR family transcriptional regulator
MPISASSIRERRKAETARALKSAARRLTYDRGLSGYTVDELCQEVGVSRRTFFNYYASRENAVIGIPVDRDESGAGERFSSLGPRGLRHLIDDLVALSLERWAFDATTKAEAEQIAKVFDAEPRLIAHLLKLAGEHEREDIGLVERREGLAPGDPRAAAAVQLVGTAMRSSFDEFFQSGTDRNLEDLVRERVQVFRELLG